MRVNNGPESFVLCMELFLLKKIKKKIQNIWNIPNILYLCCMVKLTITKKVFKIEVTLKIKEVKKILKWIIF